MKKKILSFVLAICLIIPALIFGGCSNSKKHEGVVKFTYLTFNAHESGSTTVNGILTARWYKYSVNFSINNKTNKDIDIYTNNLIAEVIIDGEINNFSISLYQLETEENLGDKITIEAGDKLDLIGIINGKINMLNNAERKINVYHIQELKFTFIPVV